jgi:oligoendopeptidase F
MVKPTFGVTLLKAAMSEALMNTTHGTGATEVRWDLNDLYRDLDDASLEQDVQQFLTLARQFDERHRGKLHESLGQALREQAAMQTLSSKVLVYLMLRRSTDATNPEIERRIGQVQEAFSVADANHLNFFEHELVALSDEQYAAAASADATAEQHRSYLDYVRANRQYLLSEEVERALTLRGPYGPSEWTEFMNELEAELRFSLDDRQLRLPELLHVLSNDPDASLRAKALEVLSRGLHEQHFEHVMARTLNVVMGAKAVEDRERGYQKPISARNIGNRVDDETVEALHLAVAQAGATQARRYYRLLGAHLGQKTLRWSDRNAPLPFSDNRTIVWDDCVETVLAAYGSFSPTLRDMVWTMFERRWVDAPPYAGKTGGAFNCAILLPNDEARAYNFLNYLGSSRDVMTVAHEAGHGVHGMLAAKAQGALMFRAPMAYAETASIFGEMTTFRYLLERAETDQQKLALLMDKCSDHVNSVVRQISFSNFEKLTHERRRSTKLTVDDFNQIWLEVTRAFYGPDGELFSYESAHNLWAYVTHFQRPFYVYAYAFGELFTQSLYAVRQQFGANFEPMYLDLLRAGGSKNAVELMQPFGLDPREPSFWSKGIAGSIEKWLDQAEVLSKNMGVQA